MVFLLPAVGFIAAFETFDYVREQRRKSRLRAFIDENLLDEHGNLRPNQEENEFGIAVTKIGSEFGSRKYYIQINSDGQVYEADKFMYDYDRGVFQHWKKRREFGWKI